MYALRLSELDEYTDVASAQCARAKRKGPSLVRVDASLINLGVGALLLSGGANPNDEHDRYDNCQVYHISRSAWSNAP